MPKLRLYLETAEKEPEEMPKMWRLASKLEEELFVGKCSVW